MHTYWVRANAVFFYGLNVLLGLACLAWASCLVQDFQLKANVPFPVIETVAVNQLLSLRALVVKGHPGAHGGSDRALLSLDLAADLRPAFHWNLKQLFVFVLASYETDLNPINEVILWDKIVETEEDALLDEHQVYVKYGLIDQINGLRGNNISISLVWDHMPVTGRLFMQQGFGSTYQLPREYFPVSDTAQKRTRSR